MTAFTLSLYKTHNDARDWFFSLNKRGFLTAGFIILCASALLFYFGLLFWMTQTGFSLEQIRAQKTDLEETALRLDMEIRADSYGTTARREFVSRMEPVRSITYLLPDNVAVTEPVSHP